MRRTLTQRTNQLAREMRDRRDAALEFQGAMQERTRLAANLHDTLLQTMAGVAYQIEACGAPRTKVVSRTLGNGEPNDSAWSGRSPEHGLGAALPSV